MMTQQSSRELDMFADSMDFAVADDCDETFSGVPSERRWCCTPGPGGNESLLLDEFLRKRRNGVEQKLPRRLKFYGRIYATTSEGRLTLNGVKDLLDACHMWISCLPALKSQPEISRLILEDTMRLLIHVDVAARFVAFHDPAEYELISLTLLEAMKRVQSIQTVAMMTSEKEFRDDFRLHAVLFFWLKCYSILTISREIATQQEGQFSNEGVLPIYGSLIMFGLIRIAHQFDKNQPIPCECARRAWSTVFFESGTHFWQYFGLSTDDRRTEIDHTSEDSAFLRSELKILDSDPINTTVFFDVAMVLISTLIAESRLESDFINAHEAAAKILSKARDPDLSRCFCAVGKLFVSQAQNTVGGGSYLTILQQSLANLVKSAHSPIADLPDLASNSSIQDFASEICNFRNGSFSMPSGLVKPSYAWALQVHVQLFSLICSDLDLWEKHEMQLWTFFKQLFDASKSGEELNSILLVILCLLHAKSGRLMAYFLKNLTEQLRSLFNTANPQRLLPTCCLVSLFTSNTDALEVMVRFDYKLRLLPMHFDFFLQQGFTGFYDSQLKQWERKGAPVHDPVIGKYFGFCVAKMSSIDQANNLHAIQMNARKVRGWANLEFITEFVVQFLRSATSYRTTSLSTLWIGVAMAQWRLDKVRETNAIFCKRMLDCFEEAGRFSDDFPPPPDNPKEIFKWYLECISFAIFDQMQIDVDDWFHNELVNAWKDAFNSARNNQDLDQQKYLFDCFCSFTEVVGEQIYVQQTDKGRDNRTSVIGLFVSAVKIAIIKSANTVFIRTEKLDFLLRTSMALLKIPFTEDLLASTVSTFIEEMGDCPRIKDILSECSKSRQGELVLKDINQSGRNGIESTPQMRDEWAKIYGETFGIYFGTELEITTSNLEIMKEVCIRQFSKFPNRPSNTFGEGFPLETSIILAKREQADDGFGWKETRSIVSPTFSRGKLKLMHDSIYERVKTLADVLLEKAASTAEVDVYSEFQAFNMDIVGHCAFAVECNSLRDRNDPFYVNCKQFFHEQSLDRSWAMTLAMLFHPPFSGYGNFMRRNSAVGQREHRLLNQLREVVKTRRSLGKSEKVDLMQLLMDQSCLNDQNQRMPTDRIVANCYAFLLAGYETTSTSMAFTAWFLAKHQDVQERLYQELMQRCGDKAIDYNTMQKLPYLDAVYKESLRIYPVVFFTARKCIEETTVCGIRFPKDVMVSFPILSIHTNPKNWPDPLKFDPNRFLGKKYDPMTWVPYGIGPRNCVGWKFAEHAYKLAIAEAVRKVKFEPGTNFEDPVRTRLSTILYRPLHGVLLKITPRKS